jgi:hypothetical protein
LTNSEKVRNAVMPAEAGIQNYIKILDSRPCGKDAKGGFKTFYEIIIIHQNQLSISAGSLIAVYDF